MERKFDITMYVPLGSRRGTLYFTEDQAKIYGILNLLGSKDSFTGTIDSNGLVTFTGRMTSPLHSFSYVAKGHITGSDIELKVTGDRYSFRMTGEEINA